MKRVLDSSALAKRYIQEIGSQRLLKNVSELSLCIILASEVVSGLNRRMREGISDLADYRAVGKQLLNDVRDAIILQIAPSVVSDSFKLLEIDDTVDIIKI